MVSAASPKFHGGVVYDEADNRYHEFKSEQSIEMAGLLDMADELISHSGRRHDIPILESTTEGLAKILRPIPHWDLFDIGDWSTLDDLSTKYICEAALEMKAAYDARCKEIDLQYPPKPWGEGCWPPKANFQESKLAKAYYDVRRTYAVWKVMLASNPDFAPSCSDDG